MRRSLLLFIGIFLLVSCRKSVDQAESASINKDKESVTTVIAFLKWYQENFDRVNQFPLINHYSVSEEYDSTHFYSVNFKETGNYLSALKESNLISEKYIKKWENYFKICDSKFKSTPQNDGPPEGFEFDFILWNQEPKYTLENVDSLKMIEVLETPFNATVKIDIASSILKFDLTKEKEKWLIDNVEHSN